MRPPSFDERCEVLEELGFDLDGEIIEAAKTSQLRMVRKLVAMSKKFYVSVDLENKDGEKVTSFDDMQFVEELHPVLTEIAMKMGQGFKVGNV